MRFKYCRRWGPRLDTECMSDWLLARRHVIQCSARSGHLIRKWTSVSDAAQYGHCGLGWRLRRYEWVWPACPRRRRPSITSMRRAVESTSCQQEGVGLKVRSLFVKGTSDQICDQRLGVAPTLKGRHWVASLAAVSVVSFPCIPLCPGVQTKWLESWCQSAYL